MRGAPRGPQKVFLHCLSFLQHEPPPVGGCEREGATEEGSELLRHSCHSGGLKEDLAFQQRGSFLAFNSSPGRQLQKEKLSVTNQSGQEEEEAPLSGPRASIQVFTDRVGMASETLVYVHTRVRPSMSLQDSVSTCLLLLGISLRTHRGQAEVSRCVFPASQRIHPVPWRCRPRGPEGSPTGPRPTAATW